MGVLLGDGCITNNGSRDGTTRPAFRLNTIDEDFAQATKRALDALAGDRMFYAGAKRGIVPTGKPYAVTLGKAPVHYRKKGRDNWG